MPTPRLTTPTWPLDAGMIPTRPRWKTTRFSRACWRSILNEPAANQRREVVSTTGRGTFPGPFRFSVVLRGDLVTVAGGAHLPVVPVRPAPGGERADHGALARAIGACRRRRRWALWLPMDPAQRRHQCGIVLAMAMLAEPGAFAAVAGQQVVAARRARARCVVAPVASVAVEPDTFNRCSP